MNINFKQMFSGGFIIIVGMVLYKTGWSNKYQGPVPKPLAIFFSTVGIIIFVTSFFTKQSSKEKKLYFCKNCNREYNAKHVAIKICPICNNKLQLINQLNKKAT